LFTVNHFCYESVYHNYRPDTIQKKKRGRIAVLHKSIQFAHTTEKNYNLGCALTWNKAEHSYDCPCHGSRFAKDGTLLNNPANKDLSQAAKKEQKHK
ncbi:MAG: Rieske 2Fe-2S domain-containing protein, partial [Lachnospiraceae bacterium]|nr:Rieske 2Fe-2S domain-containing protein [Lachnospiraceae bacterium]